MKMKNTLTQNLAAAAIFGTQEGAPNMLLCQE